MGTDECEDGHQWVPYIIREQAPPSPFDKIVPYGDDARRVPALKTERVMCAECGRQQVIDDG